jgi:hypothetical protein
MPLITTGACSSSSVDGWFIGSTGAIHRSGDVFDMSTSVTEETFNGLWAASSTEVVGITGLDAFRRTGSGWKNTGSGAYFFGVFGTAASDVWEVGMDGGAAKGVVDHWDGSSWTPIVNPFVSAPGQPVDLTGVWSSGPGKVWVGGNHVLSKYDGTTWTPDPLGTTHFVTRIFGFSATDIWALADGSTVLHYDGTKWSVQSTLSDPAAGLWGSGPKDIWAVGYAIFHFDGTSWKTTPSTATLNAVWGSAKNDVYAVGSRGTLLHFDGTKWKPEDSGTANDLYGVWGSSADHVFVGGQFGAVLRRDR